MTTGANATILGRWRLWLPRLMVGRSDLHAFAGAPEDAENLGGFLACATKPVRHLGVEGGHLAWSEHHVLVAENETHVPGQDIDPFVTVVGPWFRGDVAGRDDDLPGLHPIGLPGQRDHGPALDPTGFEPQARIALLGRRNEVVQRHPVFMRKRKQQFQSRPPLAGFEPRQGALRYPGRRRNTRQCHCSLGAKQLQPRPDLLERGGDSRRRDIVHGPILTTVSQKQQRL